STSSAFGCVFRSVMVTSAAQAGILPVTIAALWTFERPAHYMKRSRRDDLMPELPEVETVRRGLAPFMEGRRIRTLTLNRADLRFPLPADFAARVEGRCILHLSRRAKYLLIALEDDLTIIAHLGMSGSFRIEEAMDLAEF